MGFAILPPYSSLLPPFYVSQMIKQTDSHIPPRSNSNYSIPTRTLTTKYKMPLVITKPTPFEGTKSTTDPEGRFWKANDVLNGVNTTRQVYSIRILVIVTRDIIDRRSMALVFQSGDDGTG